MKVRTDFVSNSSSTSFIISTDNLGISKLDTKFFKLLSRCECLYFFAKEDGFSKELVEEAKVHFGKRLEFDENCIELDLNSIKLADKDAMSVVKKLLAEAESVTCSYGCDDCGEYVGEATQVCTILELLYGIVPEGDDHFYYDSIKRLEVEL